MPCSLCPGPGRMYFLRTYVGPGMDNCELWIKSPQSHECMHVMSCIVAKYMPGSMYFCVCTYDSDKACESSCIYPCDCMHQKRNFGFWVPIFLRDQDVCHRALRTPCSTKRAVCKPACFQRHSTCRCRLWWESFSASAFWFQRWVWVSGPARDASANARHEKKPKVATSFRQAQLPENSFIE